MLAPAWRPVSQLAATCAGSAGQQFEHRLPHPPLATGGLGFLRSPNLGLYILAPA